MSVDSLAVWKAELANLPLVSDDSWKQNLADFISDRITNKLNLQTYSPSVSFIFDKASFITQLDLVSLELQNGVEKTADGFIDGVTSSLSVSLGTSFGASTPAETFSVVSSATFDTASFVLAKAKILELESATPVADVNDSVFPEKLRAACLLLTATVVGTDSTSPPSGPLPLTDALRSVE